MAASTRIGRGTVIRGSVRGDGDVEIDGRVEGVLAVDGDLSITHSARIKAQEDVTGARVTVAGAVAGSIRGSSAIVLEDGARVVGDLSAPSIGIRPGGLLRGHVSTGDSAPPRAVARPRVADRREPAAAPRETSSRASAKAAPPTKVAPPPPPPARVPATTRAQDVAPKPRSRGAAPAPVMPALKKGQKGQLKKRNG
ncbi:MAG: polymer-forming cytoskeletal protein [Myxococcales bacterium]|nr:polymer-forming cytoskeletal protein [Myxococcales bacterium]